MKLEVLGNTLDKEQLQAALSNDDNTIIIAGAGSGKSMTMVGKIKYLVLYKRIPLEHILCITFTNNAANSLEEKIKKEIHQETRVYTFHKLALEILKEHHMEYQIASADLLDYLIEEILVSVPSTYFKRMFLSRKYSQTGEFLNYKK